MVRRLPGFRFDARPPEMAEALPRMDIAAFVGFAASGPLNVPVPVENAAQFETVFGAEATLAWDAERGEYARAHLAPTVRAFFRNGGRRCWVIRIADHAAAQPARICLAGVLQVLATADGQLTLKPGLAWARSVGSWSDNILVSTALTTESQRLQRVEQVGTSGELHVRLGGGLSPGDLLRLRFRESGLVAFVGIERVINDAAGQPASYGGHAIWFGAHDMLHPGIVWSATWWSGLDERTATALAIEPVDGDVTRIALPGLPADAPTPGSPIKLTRIRAGAAPDVVWMIAVEVIALDQIGVANSLYARGPALMLLPPPVAVPGDLPMCERLTLSVRIEAPADLTAAVASTDVVGLDSLQFGVDAPRYWGALPTDTELFTRESADVLRERSERHDLLWREAASPRFPLAGRDPKLNADTSVKDGALFTFPLAVAGLPEILSPMTSPVGMALARDGLARFSSDLFLDAALDRALTADLLGVADDVRYIAPVTRALRGIHAALAIEEVTLVAAPDATHRPWQPVAPWRRTKADDPAPLAPPTRGTFVDCGTHAVSAPVLRVRGVDSVGTIRLEWTSGGVDSQSTFVLEEASQRDFGDSFELDRRQDRELTLYGRGDGDHYYHVREVDGSNTSAWSAGVVAHVGPERGWEIPALDGDGAPAFDLLTVQRGLLRMCAARGDLFALLNLPEHYRETDAITHAGQLAPSQAPTVRTDTPRLELALSFGERAALSFGALYHPWPIEADGDGRLRRLPPDGAVCGVIARRAVARGAWVAPANERLYGLLGLTPSLDPARWLDLQSAQINVLRQEPYGFVTLSTDTLSSDPDLLPINVRRLLQLLRRLALRLGSAYVFEAHDDALRRRVRRDVETVLRRLFENGAFAGDRPEHAYDVAIRGTRNDADEGRFMVDLRVAPSVPLTFLVIRMIQTPGRTAVAEVR